MGISIDPAASRTTLAALTVALYLTACSSGGGGTTAGSPPAVGAATPSSAADINLLFIGNSHTAANDLTGMVAAQVRASLPGRTVSVQVAPTSAHLDAHATDPTTLSLMRSRRWSAVILQAQNYSLSGQTNYPTDAAESLVKLAREQGAVPILFAEWPRRGINETQIILNKYGEIARNTPSCLPPVPQSFDLSLARFPAITLHDADGNHSAPAGAFLAASVLAATITGRSPRDVPGISAGSVTAETQATLRSVATETLATFPARATCPADALIQ